MSFQGCSLVECITAILAKLFRQAETQSRQRRGLGERRQRKETFLQTCIGSGAVYKVTCLILKADTHTHTHRLNPSTERSRSSQNLSVYPAETSCSQIALQLVLLCFSYSSPLRVTQANTDTLSALSPHNAFSEHFLKTESGPLMFKIHRSGKIL